MNAPTQPAATPSPVFTRNRILVLILIVWGTLVPGYLIIDRGLLTIRLRFAHEQIDIFADLVERGPRGSARSDLLQTREYIENYYPSGTKQVTSPNYSSGSN